MPVRPITETTHLESQQCKNLVLSNYGAESDIEIWLPNVRVPPLGDIVVLGAAPYGISICSIEIGEIVIETGSASRCVVEAPTCTGSRTIITNLLGEAWHVSSNVPLLFL